MIDKIKNLPMTVILAIAFLAGILLWLCWNFPPIGISLVVTLGTGLSAARIMFFFLHGR